MSKHLSILAAAVLIGLTAGQAAAQNCIPSTTNKCLVRFPGDPNSWVSRLVPSYGGTIVCDAVPNAQVQYDVYTWINSYVYACSLDQTCSWAQTNDPQAYSKFCP